MKGTLVSGKKSGMCCQLLSFWAEVLVLAKWLAWLVHHLVLGSIQHLKNKINIIKEKGNHGAVAQWVECPKGLSLVQLY